MRVCSPIVAHLVIIDFVKTIPSIVARKYSDDSLFKVLTLSPFFKFWFHFIEFISCQKYVYIFIFASDFVIYTNYK